MRALTHALEASRGYSRKALDEALRLKQTGQLSETLSSAGIGGMSDWQQQSRSRESYSLFRGWLYSAVHALSLEASGQPVQVGHISGSVAEEGKRTSPGGTKAYWLNRMPATMRSKAAAQELEILVDHPLLDALEKPNPFQMRGQFVYSFVANLNLTGWGYIIGGRDEDGSIELYSLPTTWIKPNADRTKFRVVDPTKSAQEGEEFDASQVACAYMPNPSDPRQAKSPAQSQMSAIRIDEYVQSSQENFFQQGVLPSVLVTLGKRPYPNKRGEGRPIINDAQRRQIYAVVARYMSGVANFNRPAILDGMVENVSRFSQTAKEMDWSKSEDKVRARILSALAVHPYILGEVMPGSWAQASIIERRFYKRVNTFLDMLSTAVTSLVGTEESGEPLLVWWEGCIPYDPQIRDAQLRFARNNGDITQNEFRAEIGFAPDEDQNQANLTTDSARVVATLLGQLGQGLVSNEQVSAALIEMGLSNDAAERIAGKPTDRQTLERATDELKQSINLLKAPMGKTPSLIQLT